MPAMDSTTSTCDDPVPGSDEYACETRKLSKALLAAMRRQCAETEGALVATSSQPALHTPVPPAGPRPLVTGGALRTRRPVGIAGALETPEKDDQPVLGRRLSSTLPTEKLDRGDFSSGRRASAPVELDDCALFSSGEEDNQRRPSKRKNRHLYSTEPVLRKPSPSKQRSMPNLRRRDELLIDRNAFRQRQQAGKVHDAYMWNASDELGSGSFGTVFRGRCRYDRKRTVAVKQVLRTSVEDVENLWSEINILSELDHPNVLRLLEAHEDYKHIYIVTEVCLGGGLDGWLARVAGDIEFASRIAREVTGALAHCHSHGICHRDLKLDNILLLRNSSDSPARVADFGLAKRCSKRVVTQRMSWAAARSPTVCKMSTKENEAPAQEQRALVRFDSVTGTPAYLAPEVINVLHLKLQKDAAAEEKGQPAAPTASANSENAFYDFKCDIWSMGVVVYELVIGQKPFTLEQVSEYVAEGTPLPDLSELRLEARGKALSPTELRSKSPLLWEFIMQCLTPIFAMRPSSSELLEHALLEKALTPPTLPAISDLKRRLSNYATLSKFKKACLMAASRHLGAYEHEEIRELFQKIDRTNSGTVTAKELRLTLEEAAPHTPESLGIDDFLAALDSAKTGEISFTEFLAALMDHQLEDHLDLAQAAFDSFDQDSDGLIARPELELVLRGSSADEILLKGDKDLDGAINFEEFLELLKQG